MQKQAVKNKKKLNFLDIQKLAGSVLPDRESLAQGNQFMDDEDLDFIKKVLPHKFEKSNLHYKSGEYYITSLIVTGYASYMDDLMLANLFNEIPGVITFDITKKPKEKQVDEVEKSLNELVSRESINSKVGDSLNDQYQFGDMQKLHSDLQRGSEEIIYTTLRFYVSARSLEELEKKFEDLKSRLDILGMKNILPENEMPAEYRALQNTADTIKQPIPVIQTFSRQFPFWHQTHKDPNGIVFGLTPTGGIVILDTFIVTPDRKSFDILLTGLKGAGKSATLKSMAQDYAALGHTILMIDVDGELSKIANKIGARIIRPGREKSSINVLQLMRMFSRRFDDESNYYYEDTDESRLADLRENYTAELARVSQFMHQYLPNLSDVESDELDSIFQDTYYAKGITEYTDLSKVPPNNFPLFSDVLANLRKKLYIDKDHTIHRSGLTSNKIAIYEKLESNLKPLAEGAHAPIFNQYTSVDVNNESVVIFNISALSEMGDRVYNAFMFTVLSMIWGEIYKNRVKNSYIKNEADRKYCIAIIDEAHMIMSTKNPQGLDFIEKLVRRSRKYDSALWFASQNTRDFAPSGATEHLDKIRNIFSMVQYKMIMQQDESSVDLVTALFPQFTKSEIISTSVFKKGEMLLSLGSGQKIRLQKYIPESDFAYFDGGR